MKEELAEMCADVLRCISESAAKLQLQAFRLRSPLTSVPLTEEFGVTGDNLQRSLATTFSQALSDVVGADVPGRISPKFTEAMAKQVTGKILSVTSGASLDEGSSSSPPAAASCPPPEGTAADENVEGAISIN